MNDSKRDLLTNTYLQLLLESHYRIAIQNGRRVALQVCIFTLLLFFKQEIASPPLMVFAYLMSSNNNNDDDNDKKKGEKKTQQPACSWEITLTHFTSSMTDLLHFVSAILFYLNILVHLSTPSLPCEVLADLQTPWTEITVNHGCPQIPSLVKFFSNPEPLRNVVLSTSSTHTPR